MQPDCLDHADRRRAAVPVSVRDPETVKAVELVQEEVLLVAVEEALDALPHQIVVVLAPGAVDYHVAEVEQGLEPVVGVSGMD